MNTISSEGIRRFASISPHGDLWWRLPARPGGAGGCRPDQGIVDRIGAQVSSSGLEIIITFISSTFELLLFYQLWRVDMEAPFGEIIEQLRHQHQYTEEKTEEERLVMFNLEPRKKLAMCRTAKHGSTTLSNVFLQLYTLTYVLCNYLCKTAMSTQEGPPRHPAGAARYRGCCVQGLQEAGGGPGPGGGGDTRLPRTPGLQEPRGEACLRLQRHAGPKGDNLETLAIGLQTGQNCFTNIITPRKWHCIISVAVYVAMFIIQFWLFIITFIFSLF